MHPKNTQTYLRLSCQKGAALIMSLLLMTILTLLSITAMQSSFLSFKNQASRLGVQKNIGELNQFQSRAVKHIKRFIDSRGHVTDEKYERNSEGFLLLEEILAFGDVREDEVSQELTKLLSYSLSHTQVDVYISQSRLSVLNDDHSLQQFMSYENERLKHSADQRYLYLQLHCIASSRHTENQSSFHVVGDFRFEV